MYYGSYEGIRRHGVISISKDVFQHFQPRGAGFRGAFIKADRLQQTHEYPITNIGYMFPSFFKADRLQQADPRVRDAADQFAGGRLQEVVRGGRTRGSSLSAQNKLLARLRIRPFFDRMPKGEITRLGVHVSF